MSIRSEHEQSLIDSGFGGLAEPHTTILKTIDGLVEGSIDIAITQPKSEKMRSFGVDLRNQEAINITFSLSALGYRPRVGGRFPLDGKEWFVRSAPPHGADVVKITLARSTS